MNNEQDHEKLKRPLRDLSLDRSVVTRGFGNL